MVEVDRLATPAADIYGGLGLDPICTTGFSVREDGGSSQGVLTAGHCRPDPEPGEQSFQGQVLPRVGEAFGGSSDAQWHRAGEWFSVKPWVRDGVGSTKTIRDARPRSSQSIGDQVCR